ncbi:MAG: hypothetical protein C0508_03720 [Cyanobacteria bacterium PR.023]|nr:hypothetical protein [Cyanobacteria bacterium PR.023]
MNICRKEFRYTAEQELQPIQVTPGDPFAKKWFDDRGEVLVQLADLELEEGLFKKNKITIPQYRRLSLDEVLQNVTEFINSVGKENLVTVSETSENKYMAGDLGTKIWAIWYWQVN